MINADFIRVICSVFVVLIHVLGFLKIEVHDIISTIIRTSVPVFFILSGFFIYGSNLGLEKTKNRVLRLAKIMFVSNVAYVIIFNPNEVNILSANFYHLWFLHALLFLYIGSPLWCKIVRIFPEKFLIISIFLISYLLDYGISLGIEGRLNDFLKGLMYVPYFIIGSLLRKALINNYRHDVFLVMIALSNLFVAISIGSSLHYISPIILSSSILLVIALNNIKEIKIDSSSCLTIYLVHPFFIAIASKVQNQNDYIFLFVFTLMLFAYLYVRNKLVSNKN